MISISDIVIISTNVSGTLKKQQQQQKKPLHTQKGLHKTTGTVSGLLTL